MKTVTYIKSTLLATALLAGHIVPAQNKGDEDKDMFNKAKARDQQAIDKAVKGWWAQSMKTHDQRIDWWRKAKFGMFIHWGVYSQAGGEWKGQKVSGYAEHLMRKERSAVLSTSSWRIISIPFCSMPIPGYAMPNKRV